MALRIGLELPEAGHNQNANCRAEPTEHIQRRDRADTVFVSKSEGDYGMSRRQTWSSTPSSSRSWRTAQRDAYD